MYRSAILLLAILAFASAQITYTVVNGTVTGVLSTQRNCNAGDIIGTPAATTASTAAATTASTAAATTASTAAVTTAEATTASLTTEALTSSALTSAELTSTELTSAALTSQELTSAELTSTELTTAALTSQELTSQALTSQELTSQALTSQALTSQALTSQALTSQALTSQALTSQALTSQALTSQALTSQALTSQALTSQALTSQALTSQALTSQELTSQELTSQALTSQELTTGTGAKRDLYNAKRATCAPRLTITPAQLNGKLYLSVYFNIPLPQGVVTSASLSITYGGVAPVPAGFYAVVSYNNANVSSTQLLGNATGDYSKYITQNNTVNFPGGLRVNTTTQSIRVTILYSNQNPNINFTTAGVIYVDSVQYSFTFTPLNNTNGTSTSQLTTGKDDNGASQLASFAIAMLIASIIALLF